VLDSNQLEPFTFHSLQPIQQHIQIEKITTFTSFSERTDYRFSFCFSVHYHI